MGSQPEAGWASARGLCTVNRQLVNRREQTTAQTEVTAACGWEATARGRLCVLQPREAPELANPTRGGDPGPERQWSLSAQAGAEQGKA